MNTEIKAKWVAALRSGEYQQGTGRLRVGQNFCCLGVLTDLYIKEHPTTEKWKERAHPEVPHVFNFDGLGGVLGDKVKNWCGLHECKREICDLINMNDVGNSFSSIADHIEKVL